MVVVVKAQQVKDNYCGDLRKEMTKKESSGKQEAREGNNYIS
jgi:hypothetical protein